MIRVSVEVSSSAARLSVSVRAESIQRAVSMVEVLYPSADVWVVHPIEPETFFIADIAAADVLPPQRTVN